MMKGEIGQKCRNYGKTNSYSIFVVNTKGERVLERFDIDGKTVLQ